MWKTTMDKLVLVTIFPVLLGAEILQQRPSASGPSDILAPQTGPAPSETILDLWIAVASSQGLPPSIVARVAELTCEWDSGCKRAGIPGGWERFSQSLHTFLEQYKPSFLDNQTSDGTCYWTGYLLGMAGERSRTTAEDTAAGREYEALLKAACSNHRERLKSNLGREGSHLVPLVNRRVERMETTLLRKFAELRADPLFPGFKSRPTKELKAFFAKWVESYPVPRYEEPKQLFVAKDEAFTGSLNSYLRDLVNILLHRITIAEINRVFIKNDVWGTMTASADSCGADAAWPSLVTMVPAHGYNAAVGFRSATRPSTSSRSH
jgi:hypothetical protein